MLSSKKWTCKGTLRQIFIRVYRLEIKSVTCWYFRPSFVNCCPPNLLSGSSIPPPFTVWISILYIVYTATVCKGGVVLGPINTCRTVHTQVNFFRWRHFALPSMSLTFLRLVHIFIGGVSIPDSWNSDISIPCPGLMVVLYKTQGLKA